MEAFPLVEACLLVEEPLEAGSEPVFNFASKQAKRKSKILKGSSLILNV